MSHCARKTIGLLDTARRIKYKWNTTDGINEERDPIQTENASNCH